MSTVLQHKIKKAINEQILFSCSFHFKYLPGRVNSFAGFPILQRFAQFDNKQFDIVHCMGQIRPISLAFRSHENVVLSIHDTIPLHDEFFDPLNSFHCYCRRYLPKQANEASAIITVSEFSKKEIIKYLSVPSEKIYVTSNASQWRSKPYYLDEKNTFIQKNGLLPKHFFLAVSSFEPRKNFLRLIKAFQIYRQSKDYTGEKLVIVGGKGLSNDDIYSAIHDAEDVFHFDHVDEETLMLLYHAAKGFFNVSLIEGFGIPLLEAMSCGTPACYATGSSMDEIGRNAALRVDPQDIDSIAEAFKRLSAGGKEIDDMKKEALQIAEEYTWEKTAIKTYAVYSNLMGGAIQNAPFFTSRDS